MTNYIKRFYDEEIWKEIQILSPFKEKFNLYVSNYGNMRKNIKTSGIVSNMTQLLTEGYPSCNLGLMSPIGEVDKAYFIPIREDIKELKNAIKTLNNELIYNDNPVEIVNKISESEKILLVKINNYKKKYKKRESKRRKTLSGLVHRWVAMHFLDKPSENHNLVAHLDYDKLNNHHSNLKWMTRPENAKHQLKSPFVIKAKAKVLVSPIRRTNTKLTEKEVMIIKKRINEGVPLSQLAKRYAVTETQLLRIKRGINWGKVSAAL